MMKELLETYFGEHYHSPKKASASSDLVRGGKSFADEKACFDCKRCTPDAESTCDKVVFVCDTGESEVEAVALEDFLNNYNNLKSIPSREKCDLLLVGDEKIVFCEMTCSKAERIAPFKGEDGEQKIGKRNYARKQLGNSIKLLVDVEEIGKEILAKKDRIALFAYREKPETKKDELDTLVMTQMKGLNIVGDKVSSETMYSDMENGFQFAEIKYPNVYRW